MSIFGRGSGGLCLCVSEEGFCQDIAQLESVREGE